MLDPNASDDAVAALMELHGRQIAAMLVEAISTACASEARAMTQADLALGIRPLLLAAGVLTKEASRDSGDEGRGMLAALLRSYADDIDSPATAAAVRQEKSAFGARS